MMERRGTLAVLLLLGIGPALSAQQASSPAPPQPPAPTPVESTAQPPAEPQAQVDPVQGPTYRTGTDAVSVDVSVLDGKGNPIRGLTTRDFTVTVAGQERRVISAEYVDAKTEEGESPGPDWI